MYVLSFIVAVVVLHLVVMKRFDVRAGRAVQAHWPVAREHDTAHR